MPNTTPAKPLRIRGQIEKVFFSSPAFSAGILQTEDGKVIHFNGNIFAEQSQPVILTGSWTTHPKYGRQFKVDYCEHDLSMNHEGLARYLANHPELKGIGTAKAFRIVEELGETFEDTLLNNPERIADIARVPLQTIKTLQQEWLRKRHVNSVLAYLSAYGLTFHQTSTLVEKYGSNCIPLLKKDPYILIRDIRGFGFKKVDTIARQLGTAKEHPGRIQAALHFCLEDALNQGHCWMSRSDLVDAADQILFLDSLASKEMIDDELSTLIDSEDICTNTYRETTTIALPHIYTMERFVAEVFAQSNADNPYRKTISSIDNFIASEQFALNEGQYEAVAMALSKRLCLISGMAGTGKSRCMSVITGISKKRGLKVALAAPTGKAAKRMEELANHEAMTIHRLLEYGREGFARNENFPIDANVLLIDEVGMIDTPLAYNLFKAIDFNKTSVALFGDPNQLPPVGPGNMLRDLVRIKPIPTVILNTIMRQAGVLKNNCTAILKGDVASTAAQNDNGVHPWFLIDKCGSSESTQKFILDIFASNQLERLGFDAICDVQLLTPTHKGPLGTQELNIKLQRILQKKFYDNDILFAIGEKTRLYPFDKVIQNRNNYDLGVMNGSIGQVSEIRPNGTVVVMFDNNRYVELKKGSDDLRDISLAYCLTCHRVQGSEFPCAMMIVHSAHSFMLNRGLFYTGVTRARKTAVIIGDRKGISYAAGHCQVNHRRTFLPLWVNAPQEEALDVQS
jgi:exodeoxyribonuclease V alpha subunit